MLPVGNSMSRGSVINRYVGAQDFESGVIWALIQRVNEASVLVEGEVVGSIGTGVCVFIGVSHDDDLGKAEKMARKIWKPRFSRMKTSE